ncbi:MAG: hypothetical protein IPK26_03595 [Planctomycetes bacterium]|nr:hypothetical protein [Planctomycetota bacterium]
MNGTPAIRCHGRYRRQAGPRLKRQPVDADPKGMRTLEPAAIPRSPSVGREAGSALIWSLFFVSVTTGLMLSHSWEMRANRKQMDVRFRQIEHARSFAKSGLVETASWFQKQTVQPVTVFAPRREPTAEPPIDETDEPTIGLVREFEVRGSLWGRYEIRKDETVDVSANYGAAAGTVWDVGARGILFQRLDAGKAFDRYPNFVIAVQTTRTEVRTMIVNLPAPTALVIPDPGNLTMTGTGVTISGGSQAGIACDSALAPLATPPSVSGSPAVLPLPGLQVGPESLFAMRAEKLELLADLTVTSEEWPVRRPLADRFAFASSTMVVLETAPLLGSGVLFVNGSMKVAPGSNSEFEGLIVINGDASLHGPFSVRGSLVVSGHLELHSESGPVELIYDTAVLTRVQDQLGRYHKSKETRGGAGGEAFTSLVEFADKMRTGTNDADVTEVASVTDLTATSTRLATTATDTAAMMAAAMITEDTSSTAAKITGTEPTTSTTTAAIETVVAPVTEVVVKIAAAIQP